MFQTAAGFAMGPSSAIVAVTRMCNARCVMCDMWKCNRPDEMAPADYLKLPHSLTDVNITGGEPFLRRDLLQVLQSIKQACPRSRPVVSSNGLLVERIQQLAPQLLSVDPRVAVRISIDGIDDTHDRLRGVTGAYDRALQSIDVLRNAGIRDLGIGMTITAENVNEVGPVYELAEGRGLEFSISIATDSTIFFGQGKSQLRPQATGALVEQLESLSRRELRHPHPKRWLRAWFARGLLRYTVDGRRSLACDAGDRFFYLDSDATVYRCHVRPHRLGSLREEDWDTLWGSAAAGTARRDARCCEACWMVCTARTQMSRNLLPIGADLLVLKLRDFLRRAK